MTALRPANRPAKTSTTRPGFINLPMMAASASKDTQKIHEHCKNIQGSITQCNPHETNNIMVTKSVTPTPPERQRHLNDASQITPAWSVLNIPQGFAFQLSSQGGKNELVACVIICIHNIIIRDVWNPIKLVYLPKLAQHTWSLGPSHLIISFLFEIFSSWVYWQTNNKNLDFRIYLILVNFQENDCERIL